MYGSPRKTLHETLGDEQNSHRTAAYSQRCTRPTEPYVKIVHAGAISRRYPVNWQSLAS